jgi:hypothetical protein
MKDIIILSMICCIVCVCVKIAYGLTRFRILVILFPHLSTAYEQIHALQTRFVTEQTVFFYFVSELSMITNVSRLINQKRKVLSKNKFFPLI